MAEDKAFQEIKAVEGEQIGADSKQRRNKTSGKRPFSLKSFIGKHWIPLSFLLLVSGLFVHLVILPAICFMLYQPKEGDLIFQALPMGALTATIEGATNSPYSHVGLVIKGEDGSWQVLEAFETVRPISLRDFWLRGRRLNFRIYQFRQDAGVDIRGLIGKAKAYQGLPYDVQYEMDDAKMYCSELIYKAYEDLTGKPLGRLQRLGELNWQPYAKVIEAIEPGKPPLDREIISPKSMSDAPELIRGWGYGI